MTGAYSRFEVRYRVVAASALAHVWGWADDRKGVDRLLKGLAVNAQLQHVETVDRASTRHPARPVAFEPAQARPGLLI